MDWRPTMSMILPTVLALASAANAQDIQTQTNQLNYSGVIQPGCIMAAATLQSALNATVSSPTPGAADVVVDQFVRDDAVPVGAEITLSMMAACNQAHTLRVTSQNGALVNVGSQGPTGPFRDNLTYSVAVAWAGDTQSFDSSDRQQARSVGDASRGPIIVTIQIPAGGAPMVAGSYSDQLVLELGVAG